ncbi:MAG: DsrE family protein [Deltaproteobacteria bacterium]|nr:DsrE family protein [Deltaproteobacteria bacterium]
MKIALVLKSGPGTNEADRALQTATDMVDQGHTVSLYLMQEAVRFCRAPMKRNNSIGLKELMDKKLEIHVLTHDAELRGIDLAAHGQAIVKGSYDYLIALLESCDRVVGIL